MNDRIAELEATLRDIIVGCNMMLQVERQSSVLAFIREVKRVANAPLEGGAAAALDGERARERIVETKAAGAA